MYYKIIIGQVQTLLQLICYVSIQRCGTLARLPSWPPHGNLPAHLAQVLRPIPFLDPKPLHSINQPFDWLNVLTVNGNELRLFLAKTLPILILLMSRIWHSSSRYNFLRLWRSLGRELNSSPPKRRANAVTVTPRHRRG